VSFRFARAMQDRETECGEFQGRLWLELFQNPAMHDQGCGHGRKPDSQEQNATGRPRQPTMLP
jgi:hypothetical protein